jgi:RNA polymerase sigma factor (sigma-70 family)
VTDLRLPSHPSEQADAELVASLLHRDEEAFTELFRRHSRSVGRMSSMVLGDPARSDDVIAEVFLALWLAPDSFDLQRGSLIGYLRMRAKGKSIDMIRSETSRARRERADVAIAEISRYETHHDLERTTEVGAALASLSANEKIVIELAYVQGMTYRVIATHLELPEGTVKSRIRSALRHMRENIEAERSSAVDPEPTASSA